MKESEITALSREYAEEIYRNAHKEMEVLPNCLSNEAINMFAEDMENKLKWLLRRFALVEKEAVTKCYNHAVKRLNEMKRLGSTVDDRIYNEGELNGKIDLLESLFPETIKDSES